MAGGAGGRAFSWDNTSWIGRDRDRLWVRTKGQAGATRLEDAQAQLIEAELYGKADPGRGIGVGLASADAGLRLRYEISASWPRTSAG